VKSTRKHPGQALHLRQLGGHSRHYELPQLEKALTAANPELHDQDVDQHTEMQARWPRQTQNQRTSGPIGMLAVL